MMIRRFFMTAAAAVLASVLAQGSAAQDAQMAAEEIKHLLTGNTAEGQWEGTAYKSWFGPDGTTVFAPANGDVMEGKWRVNAETDEYESFFDAIGWTGYIVLRTDAGFAWMREGKTYPFTVVEGRALGF